MTRAEGPLALILDFKLEGPGIEGLHTDVDATLPDRIGPDVLEPICDDLGRVEVDDFGTGQGHLFEAGDERLLCEVGIISLSHYLAEFGDGELKRLILKVDREGRVDRYHDC